MKNTRRPHWAMSNPRPIPRACLLAAGLALAASGCSHSSNPAAPPPPAPGSTTALTGTVSATPALAVEGATVYLLRAGQVPTDEITAAGVLAGTTEDFDEPLEDLVAASGTSFTQAVTAADGTFTIDTVDDGKYFVYVEPATSDTEHLPGGSWCRTAVSASQLRGQDIEILLSSSPPASATYTGMSVCLACHEDKAGQKMLAHRLGFRVPGVTSLLQDTSEHPEIDDGLAFFTEAADYTGGTPVYHYDYDSSRGFDKFKTSLSDPSGGGGVVYAILWLWKDSSSGEYKITIENVGNSDDPNNFTECVVGLTYGGSVHKQRYMIHWLDRNGLYPILQYQEEGDESRYERTRKQFRDYHLNFYWNDGGTPTDETDDTIKDPSVAKNIQVNCMGCHATGYTQYLDGDTGEILCDSVEDPNAEYDIDGDGFINDLNLGCETCHGQGSKHVNADNGRWIINPEAISPSREVMICGRCHDRIEGHGTVENDHPMNESDLFAPPGISRAEFLADFVTRAGPAESSFWADFEHSKSHHQQTPDFLKSAHYRNSDELLTCSSCHDPHGGTGHEYALTGDPDEPDSPLCMGCHADDVVTTAEHTAEYLGVAHGSATATCVRCHMVKTAKTGSGRYGFLMGEPTGADSDADIVYHENDITSHVFDVIRKDNVGVAGVQPGKAMPIPYTQSCGTCHDPTSLPWY